MTDCVAAVTRSLGWAVFIGFYYMMDLKKIISFPESHLSEVGGCMNLLKGKGREGKSKYDYTGRNAEKKSTKDLRQG